MSAPITKKEIGHEYVDADEDSIAAKMVDEFEAQVTRMYKDKKMLRQVHTKMHGCVKATFTVEKELPKELKVGVFKEGRTYQAWVRFSNGNTKPQKDKKKDIRGVAIKLLGVHGEKILHDGQFLESQDFLLMSSETFFAKSIKELSKLLSALTAASKLKRLFYFLNPLHLPTLMRIRKSLVSCDNPLNIPYWSTQPYQFGTIEKAVKYLLSPSPDNNIVIENTTDYNFLRHNLAQTLNDNEAKFDFYIQFQTDADIMPIEDPSIPWTSQFIKVATLIIYPQVFDSNAQMEFGENLSFNPWHSLLEHRPLGSFNRVRKRVYDTMSAFRHEKNKIPVFEPKPSDDFLQGILNISSRKTKDQQVPSKKILQTTAEVLINCSKKKAYEYVSSVKELPNWLLKAGPIYGIINVTTLRGNWEKVGDNRLVKRGDGATLVEELISVHHYSHYAYQTTDFSDVFRHLTRKTYGQMWIDTVDDKTRLRWVYTFTYRNIFAKLFLMLFVPLFLKKYLQNGLNNAKAYLED
ncbi:SRPBCC family protein [Cyclobacterium jeungdonense]|uniref:SRPBCC family protein n=1 Tax=Cyclobacterium jeungdonense TaxID=708087 RepID=A0ABT8C2Y5_9BACT|nr:SRPBCC family protein [Cyclobacterium jeungdonense]MDN3687129.1 SRPBCC family protein [Cyclobacterium jeungdonense]